jgi:hypothetical protein
MPRDHSNAARNGRAARFSSIHHPDGRKIPHAQRKGRGARGPIDASLRAPEIAPG